MRSDFYGLPYAARQAIRKGEQACSRGRRLAIAAASEKSASAELLEVLEGVLPLLEKIEGEMLVGDEGCLWPVELARDVVAKHRGER